MRITIDGKGFEIDKFTQGYLETALFSSTDNSRDDGGDPLDDNYGVIDFSKEAVAGAVRECREFREANAEDLEASGLDDEEAGGLFWLNRNGHGVGFWDKPGGEVGDRLSDAAHVYGSVDLYIGDDGKVHASGYESEHVEGFGAARGAGFKIGEVVVPRWFIAGEPMGLSVDTRVVIREVRKKDRRLRVERDDGRQGSWWVDFDAVRRLGEGGFGACSGTVMCHK